MTSKDFYIVWISTVLMPFEMEVSIDGGISFDVEAPDYEWEIV